MSRKRYFIGFSIPSSIVAQVGEWQKNHGHWPIRFTAGRNLHITMVPPWEGGEFDSIKKTIDELSLPTTGLLNFTFNWVCFGPDPEEPRLIWAEGELPSGLAELKYRLEESLWLPRDKRPLRPHLTIARFRPEDLRRLPQKELGELVNWSFTVDRFALFESRPGKGGSEYAKVAEWSLK